MRKESLKRDNYEGTQDSDSDSSLSNTENNANTSNNGAADFDALFGNSNTTTTKANDDLNKDSPDNDAWSGGEATTKVNGKVVDQDDEEAVDNDDSIETGNEDAVDKTLEKTNESAENGSTSNGQDGNYEVEAIVDHRYIGKRKKEYLIRWKGYEDTDNTWEPEKSLDCQELIDQYLETHPDTRPPKKEPKPPKPKKERPPGIPARDAPKRKLIKPPVLDLNADDLVRKSKKKNKQKGKTQKQPTEYEVGQILDDKIVAGKTTYLIRWKGYGRDSDTWESADNLACENLLNKYWAKKSKVDYEVERICGHMVEANQTFYFVKWKGYTAGENTWEPAKTVNCPDLINEYVQKHFSAHFESKSHQKPLAPKASKKSVVEMKRSASKSPKTSPKKRKIADSDSDDENRDPLAIDDDEDEEEEEWEVEEILEERIMKGEKEYLIRWKGFEGEDTWEKADQVNCPDLIAKFQRKQRNTPTKKGTPNKAGKRVSIQLPQTRKSSRRT